MSAGTLQREAASAAPMFDPSAWLAALTEAGGGYAMASGRKLWLVVDQVPADALVPLMAVLVGHPERQDAVRDAVERRQIGELAA